MTLTNPPEDSIQIEISEPLEVSTYISDVPFKDSIDEETSTSAIDSLAIADLRKPLVRDVSLQPTVKQEIQDWVTQKREGARNWIAITLIVFFGVSLLAEFLLIGLGAFYPQANSDLIKDTLPLLINSLTSILSLALAFYFKEK
jgi:hypothetical protein